MLLYLGNKIGSKNFTLYLNLCKNNNEQNNKYQHAYTAQDKAVHKSAKGACIGLL
jgi:hypothetical protein